MTYRGKQLQVESQTRYHDRLRQARLALAVPYQYVAEELGWFSGAGVEREIRELELREAVETALRTISGRDASILRSYFGLWEHPERATLQTIADHYNLNRERGAPTRL